MIQANTDRVSNLPPTVSHSLRHTKPASHDIHEVSFRTPVCSEASSSKRVNTKNMRGKIYVLGELYVEARRYAIAHGLTEIVRSM